MRVSEFDDEMGDFEPGECFVYSLVYSLCTRRVVLSKADERFYCRFLSL